MSEHFPSQRSIADSLRELGIGREQARAEARMLAGLDSYEELIAALDERAQGKPIQYVLGKAYFRYLELEVDERVLIPRPETELLVDLALARLSEIQTPRILDIGTGSGCIAISMALELPGALVRATDISAAALEVAKANARRYEVAPGRLAVDHADLVPDSWLQDTYDLIVSNPPYVRLEEHRELSPEVKQEPREALITGEAGMEIYRRLSQLPINCRRWLLEIDYRRVDALAELWREIGDTVTVHQDFGGLKRYLEIEKRSWGGI